MKKQYLLSIFALCLLCLTCAESRSDEGDATPGAALPPIAGTKVEFETNPGLQRVEYTGTDQSGKFLLTLIPIEGKEQSIAGDYTLSDEQGWWKISHKHKKGVFYILFRDVKSGGGKKSDDFGDISGRNIDCRFKAVGRVFDADGNPAMGGAMFDFYFVQTAVADNDAKPTTP